MILKKNANNINLSHTEIFKDKIGILYAAVDAYAGLTLSRDVWLSEREVDFFVCIILFTKLGAKRYNDSQAIEVIDKYFGEHKRQERSGYAKKLVEKKWIKMDEETRHIEIPEFFKSIDLEKGKIDFNMSFQLKEEKK